MGCVPIGQPIAISRGLPTSNRWRGRSWRPFKKAAAGARVLLSQDEARFSRIPTVRTTLGVKGHRPLVGTLDCQASLSLFGALNLVTGQLITRLVERPRPPKQGRL